MEFFREFRECSVSDGTADLAHEVQIVVEIVYCEKSYSEDFADIEQMPDV